MSSLTAKAVLQRNYLFRGLPDAALERIANLASRRSYQKGAVIFAQGERGDALFGVVAGRVRISASGAGGQEVFLNIMEPGDTFGEIAVMDGLPRTAGATALDNATVVTIRRADFLQLLEREPQLANSLAQAAMRTIAMDERARRRIRVPDGPRATRETAIDPRVAARARDWDRQARAPHFASRARPLPRHLAADRKPAPERVAAPRMGRARPFPDRDQERRGTTPDDR